MMSAVEEGSARQGPKATFKRDALVEIESAMQVKWTDSKLFQPDAPSNPEKDSPSEKFMATFPYPYMNGRLHLGHAFTLSKADFACGVQRQLGKKVLFPFGFHCTGMPIAAAAQGIRQEMERFGNPPAFPSEEDAEGDAGVAKKSSKVAAKEGRAKYKWEVLEAMGIPSQDIPLFADPKHWCDHFPPLAQEDLRGLGCSIDWRRSFITTDANPFYDAFVRWQFNRLRALNYVRFGSRHTIYSPADGQPCMDHDRQTGEGVEPEEWTCLKLELDLPKTMESPYVTADLKDKLRRTIISNQSPVNNGQVYLLAATLRPETVYGQTNCWVGPELAYGCFKGETEGTFYVCTERAARNLAFQGFGPSAGTVERVFPVLGKDLVNACVHAPMTLHGSNEVLGGCVPVLPLLSVTAARGTGIVASVPAHAPDDWAGWRDLWEKPALRAKWDIPADYLLPPITLIEPANQPTVAAEARESASASCDSLFPCPAQAVCVQFGVKSQNDKAGLEAAKQALYKDDFYNGQMSVGAHKGLPVSAAKPLIREQLLNDGRSALILWMPASVVTSRSGDECVVALVDQWYLAYGDPEWRARAEECVSRMDFCGAQDVAHAFSSSLAWMHQWACSRSFGLGSRLPWAPECLIESLSDSTVYMAYYAVAHVLHQGSLDGSISPNGIRPDQMTDAVWDYIFGLAADVETDIAQSLLAHMRREFAFWYPLDLRVSGKDLVNNHLTMFIYNHVALFPPAMWPRAIRANGHLLLNSAKMSKSTGNFMTLRDALESFGADATRIALADAGDTCEDANFLVDVANAAVLRLHALKELTASIVASSRNDEKSSKQPEASPFKSDLSFGGGFAEAVFAAEMVKAAQEASGHFLGTNYREALKHAWHELGNARDRYREMTAANAEGTTHGGLMRDYLRVQAVLMAPITPHLSEWIWTEALGGMPGSVLAVNPACLFSGKAPLCAVALSALGAAKVDGVGTILAANAFLQDCAHVFRLAKPAPRPKASKPTPSRPLNSEKSAQPADNPPAINSDLHAVIYVASGAPAWQTTIHAILHEIGDVSDKAFVEAVNARAAALCTHKSARRSLIPYAMECWRQKCKQDSHSSAIINSNVPRVDEEAVLKRCATFLQSSLGCIIDGIVKVDPDEPIQQTLNKKDDGLSGGMITPPLPLHPTIHYYYHADKKECDGLEERMAKATLTK